MPFGTAEGIGIYFDGVNLPGEVYRECDINVVLEEFSRRLEGTKERSVDTGRDRQKRPYIFTQIKVHNARSPFRLHKSYPLCRGARIVDITTRMSRAPNNCVQAAPDCALLLSSLMGSGALTQNVGRNSGYESRDNF